VVGPGTDFADEAYYDADATVAWDSVEWVVVPEAVGGTRGTCSICLGNVRVPRMTRCHHVYCYTCILRFMASAPMEVRHLLTTFAAAPSLPPH